MECAKPDRIVRRWLLCHKECKHVHAVHIHVNTATAATAATDVKTELEHHSDVLTCTPTTSEKENILPGTH